MHVKGKNFVKSFVIFRDYANLFCYNRHISKKYCDLVRRCTICGQDIILDEFRKNTNRFFGIKSTTAAESKHFHCEKKCFICFTYHPKHTGHVHIGKQTFPCIR